MPPRKKTQRRVSAAGQPESRPRTRDLVSLDSRAIRAKAIRDCQRAHTAFLKAQDELSHWEGNEMPAGRAWETAVAGERITRLRVLEEQLQRERFLLERMEDLEFISGEAPGYCHDEVMRLFGTPHGPGGQEDGDDQGTRGSAFGEDEEGDEDDDDPQEDLGDFFDQLFGGGRSRSRSRRREDAEPVAQQKGQADEDLRTLYRRLCRELHPDRGGEFDARRSDLYNQVQEAYAAKDRDRLEHLASILENGGDVPVKASRVAVILHALRRFRESTRFLRQRLREARDSPLWGFLSWSAERRAERTGAMLRHYDRQIHYGEHELAAIARHLKRFRDDAEKRRLREEKRRRRGRKPA